MSAQFVCLNLVAADHSATSCLTILANNAISFPASPHRTLRDTVPMYDCGRHSRAGQRTRGRVDDAGNP